MSQTQIQAPNHPETLSLILRPEQTSPVEGTFLIPPYLQLSKHYYVGRSARLLLRWFSPLKGDDWQVFVRCQDEYIFREMPVKRKKVDLSSAPASASATEAEKYRRQFRCQAELNELSTGKSFEYRVIKGGREVFRTMATAPMAQGQNCRIGVFGDLGDGGDGAKVMARCMQDRKPHLVVMPGDIVYDYGRVSEYLRNFFPVFNSDTTGGAKLLSSTVCAAAVGNHDVGTPKQTEVPDLSSMPDLFGYFQFWSQPQNGPKINRDRLKSGSRSARHLLQMLGRGFSRRTNYSFRFGSTYWLVLDANKYMDWSDRKLRRWLEEELAGSSGAQWKFVAFHQPPFNSDVKYHDDQRMRVLCEVFERHGVDVVFSGHCHYYECSRPLRFRAFPKEYGGKDKDKDRDTKVAGLMSIDLEFDGVHNCVPQGVIYVITGAAAKLPDEAHKPTPSSFTRRLRSDRLSLTILDVEDESLVIRQVGADGFDIDRFTVRKRASSHSLTSPMSAS